MTSNNLTVVTSEALEEQCAITEMPQDFIQDLIYIAYGRC